MWWPERKCIGKYVMEVYLYLGAISKGDRCSPIQCLLLTRDDFHHVKCLSEKAQLGTIFFLFFFVVARIEGLFCYIGFCLATFYSNLPNFLKILVDSAVKLFICSIFHSSKKYIKYLTNCYLLWNHGTIFSGEPLKCKKMARGRN